MLFYGKKLNKKRRGLLIKRLKVLEVVVVDLIVDWFQTLKLYYQYLYNHIGSMLVVLNINILNLNIHIAYMELI